VLVLPAFGPSATLTVAPAIPLPAALLIVPVNV
jgi:hypothetical protein